jgi:hypothetical protein
MKNTEQTQVSYDEYEQTQKEKEYSVWQNNTTETATFRLLTHEKRKGTHKEFGGQCQGSVFMKVIIKPGESVKLESEYDNAIRKVSKATGQVESGLCPWLTKVGEEDIVVPDVFDWKAAIMEEEAGKIMKTIKKTNDLRAAAEALKKQDEYRKEQEELKAEIKAGQKSFSPVERKKKDKTPSEE